MASTSDNGQLQKEIDGLKNQVQHLDRIIAGRTRAKPKPAPTEPHLVSMRALMDQLRTLMSMIRDKLAPSASNPVVQKTSASSAISALHRAPKDEIDTIKRRIDNLEKAVAGKRSSPSRMA